MLGTATEPICAHQRSRRRGCDVLRGDDIYGRWGGDEELVALPVTDAAGADITAARLREAAAAVDLTAIGLPDGVPA